MSNKKSLLNMALELEELLNRIEDAGGEITEAEEALYDSLKEDMQEKISAYHYFLQMVSNEQEEAKRIAEKFAKKAKSYAKKAEWMEGILLHIVKKFGEQDVVVDGEKAYKLGIKKSKYLYVGIEAIDAPKEYQVEKTTYSIDKVALKKAIEEGKITASDNLCIKEREHLKIK